MNPVEASTAGTVSEEDMVMTKFALYVPLQAKPGKEKEVADFLRSAVPLVNDEPGTVSWFAIQKGQSSFATRDAIDISLRWSAADCAGPRRCSGSARGAIQSAFPLDISVTLGLQVAAYLDARSC